MTERKVYIGSVGPFLFDDEDAIDDVDGDFDGETQKGLRTDAPIRTSHAPTEDDDMVRDQDLTSGLAGVLLFFRHTLNSGNSLVISDYQQKLLSGDFTVNGTGNLTIDGSGELILLGV